MASAATLSVSVTFDNGPKIESKGKLKSGSYVFEEEELCRCQEKPKVLELFAGKSESVELIVVTADRYAPDKEACPNGAKDEKRIKFSFNEMKEKEESLVLNGPFIVRAPHTGAIGQKAAGGEIQLDKIWLKNEMPLDAKVSVLVVRKKNDEGA